MAAAFLQVTRLAALPYKFLLQEDELGFAHKATASVVGALFYTNLSRYYDLLIELDIQKLLNSSHTRTKQKKKKKMGSIAERTSCPPQGDS